MKLIAALTLIVSSTLLAQKPHSELLSARGLKILSRNSHLKVSGGAIRVLKHPEQPAFEVLKNGLPEVSVAGFVRIRREGPGFIYANSLKLRERFARKRGEYGTDCWGIVEGFRALQRLTRQWHRLDPSGPRVVVEDISSKAGGFPDFDGDGASDHITHQLGDHFNLLLPCKSRPEVEVFLGRRNEEAFDPARTQRLARLLLGEGALALTTTSATGLLDSPEVLHPNIELLVVSSTKTRVYRIDRRMNVVLMHQRKDHGELFNVRLSPRF